MPVFLQRFAASHILERQIVANSTAGGSAYQQILTALTGEQIHFTAEGWKVGEYLAVPVSQAVNAPLGLFVSLNNGPMLRLTCQNPDQPDLVDEFGLAWLAVRLHRLDQA